MNNTINACNNMSFNGRYLHPHRQLTGGSKPTVIVEPASEELVDFVKNSPAVKKFLKEGNRESKTLLGKFINMFKRDEILEFSLCKRVLASADGIFFAFGKKHSKKAKVGFLNVDKNILKNIPDFNENRHDLSEIVLRKQLNEIDNLDGILVNNIEKSPRF